MTSNQPLGTDYILESSGCFLRNLSPGWYGGLVADGLHRRHGIQDAQRVDRLPRLSGLITPSTWGPPEATELYRHRYLIKLFGKCIKQNLKIKPF
jgi:hypothetical protein